MSIDENFFDQNLSLGKLAELLVSARNHTVAALKKYQFKSGITIKKAHKAVNVLEDLIKEIRLREND